MPRDALDRCYTDEDTAERLLSLHSWPKGCHWRESAVLDLGVGAGAFIRPFGDTFHRIAVDVDPEAPALADPDLCDEGWCLDVTDSEFVATMQKRLDKLGVVPELVVGNPPFNASQAFVDAALALAPEAWLLLPIGFLASSKRWPWWRSQRLASVTVLAERPRFGGPGGNPKGSSPYDFAWFRWSAERRHTEPTMNIVSLARHSALAWPQQRRTP